MSAKIPSQSVYVPILNLAVTPQQIAETVASHSF